MSRRARWAALDPDARVFGGCYLLLLPFFLLPLTATRLLPGLDLPFHLSIVDMMSKAGQPESPYAPFYRSTPMVAPYATHYLALWVLGKVVALNTAHKIIIALYVAGLPLAAASLLGVSGRSRIPALLAFPLAYNLTLHYGFISSALSLPVVLLLLAQLGRLLTWERPGDAGTVATNAQRGWAAARIWRGLAARWLATAALALLLFLSHLQNFLYGACAALAFVVFGGAHASLPSRSSFPWFPPFRSWRRRLLAAAALLPALAALVRWQARAAFDGDAKAQRKTLAFAWTSLKAARLSDVGWRRSWGNDLLSRLYDLPSHALRSFADGVDVRAARTLLVLVLLYFCLGLAGQAHGSEERDQRPRMVVACWVAFAGALFAYLALPHHLMVFELMTFFPRFAPLAMVMMLPLVPAGLKRFSGELRVFVPLPAVIFGVLYGHELADHYRGYGEETADFVAMLDRAQPGHKALGMVFDRHSNVMRIESTLLGLPSYYVAAHNAPGSMIPLWYCNMRHIPCRILPGGQLPDPGPWYPGGLDPDRAVPFFDYFFVRSPPRGDLFGRQQWAMELLAHQGTWWLWRRRPDAVLSPFDRRYED
jgi:hypothetical protein